jgi:chorismate mutase
MVFAVRGAIQVRSNAEAAISEASARLVREMCAQNRIAEDQIVSVIFSITEDLTAGNPAAGLRRTGFHLTPLFCVQEARCDGGMPRVIRVLLTARSRRVFGRRGDPVHVYLDGAQALRPDLQASESQGWE